ncbi:MAG: hypothetical protein RI907_171, partial [Pseudomonadota bacterium]
MHMKQVKNMVSRALVWLRAGMCLVAGLVVAGSMAQAQTETFNAGGLASAYPPNLKAGLGGPMVMLVASR